MEQPDWSECYNHGTILLLYYHPTIIWEKWLLFLNIQCSSFIINSIGRTIIVHMWRKKADSAMQTTIISMSNVLALHDINYRPQIWTFAHAWWRLMAAFIWVWSNGGIELLAKACSWSLLIITERHWFTNVSTPVERILLWALLHASRTLRDAFSRLGTFVVCLLLGVPDKTLNNVVGFVER